MPKKPKEKFNEKPSKTLSKGSKLKCNECGMVVEVVNLCECQAPCFPTCCGETMIFEC